MKQLLLVFFCFFLLLSCKNNSSEKPLSTSKSGLKNDVAVKVASAHGFDEFNEVKQLDFTFNVMVNDTLRSSRSWKWFPQEKRAELTENGKTSSYTNDGELDESESAIDQKLINDTYWLLFPFQLEWSDYVSEYTDSTSAPISGDPLQQLSIKYEGDAGYTPGDTYHIYFGDDNILQEWTYVSSNGRILSTTWEDYENFEGIKIAKMHKSEDGSFQLFFTNIKVTK